MTSSNKGFRVSWGVVADKAENVTAAVRGAVVAAKAVAVAAGSGAGGVLDAGIAALAEDRFLKGALKLRTSGLFTPFFMEEMRTKGWTLAALMEDDEMVQVFEEALGIQLDLDPEAVRGFAQNPGVRYLASMTSEELLDIMEEALPAEVHYLREHRAFADSYFHDLKRLLGKAENT